MRMSKGMTLIEVVIVVAIIAIFLGSVGGLLFTFPFSTRTAENFLTAARAHERAMSVMREEFVLTSADMVVPKFWILDEDDNEITYELGLEKPGVKIRFRKFTSFSLVHTGSLTVGKCAFDTEVEFYRDPDTDCVMRRQRDWDAVGGVWGAWSEPRVIGAYCNASTLPEPQPLPLTFTELPARRIKISMINEVGDPERSYVGVYSNSVEVTPEN